MMDMLEEVDWKEKTDKKISLFTTESKSEGLK